MRNQNSDKHVLFFFLPDSIAVAEQILCMCFIRAFVHSSPPDFWREPTLFISEASSPRMYNVMYISTAHSVLFCVAAAA